MLYEAMPPIIFTAIYVLAITNAMLIVLIYLRRLWVIMARQRFARQSERLRPTLDEGLERVAADPGYCLPLSRRQRRIAFRLLLQKAREQDLHEVFDRLQLTQELIAKYNEGNHMCMMAELALIKSPLSREFLFDILKSLKGEPAYRTAYALVMIPHDGADMLRLVSALLHAQINLDRAIELLDILDPGTSLLLEFLGITREERIQVIILRCLQGRKLSGYRLAAQLAPLLTGSVEVQVASVLVLGSTGSEDALGILEELAKNGCPWPVRATIAKVLPQFPAESALPLLKKLTEDDAWWVKYNAFGSLSHMGQPGLDAIIELALKANNPLAVDMAYQMLNASADIHHTLNKLQGEVASSVS